MKKIYLLLVLFSLSFGDEVYAQDISIKYLEYRANDLTAKANPVFDNAGIACSLIRFSVRDTTFLIEGNMGILKRKVESGEIFVYVPSHTKRLTIRHDNLYPLRDYELPIRLEPYKAYHAMLVAKDDEQDMDIFITHFEQQPFLSQQTIVDKKQNPCAKIRFSVPSGRKFQISADEKIRLKSESQDEVSIYVPQGTSYLTLKSKNLKTLKSYRIPVPIESGNVYDAVVKVSEDAAVHMNNTRLYVALGFNAVNLLGPSIAFGVKLNNHYIELGSVLGLNKSDDFRAYPDLGANYQYKLTRLLLRYGYGINIYKGFSIIPMIGVNCNLFHGTETAESEYNRWDLKDAYSFSVFGGLRLAQSINRHLVVNLTTDYSASLKMNVDAAELCWRDTTCDKWTKGMNLNLGLCYIF